MPQLDINQSFKSARMKINAFLRRQRWKEALIFFFFVLLSLGFWLLQSLQQEYEIEISIPVRYKNIPPDISFTETPPQEIIAKVKDKGSVLLNYSFGRSFAPIETNMKNQAEKSGSLSITKKTIQSDIQKQLLATTSLVGFEPQSIEAAHENGLPLVMDNTVATAYLVRPLELGADIVVNSTSKYVNGNSDAISGVITDSGNFKWDKERYPGHIRRNYPDKSRLPCVG